MRWPTCSGSTTPDRPEDNNQLSLYRSRAGHFLEAAGDAATAVHSNAGAFSSYADAFELTDDDPETSARLLEKRGDVALRLGRVDAAIEVWEQALEFHSSRGELEHVAELHRKIGAGLAHRGDRRRAIEHHQLGINLIKDGEPSLTLVRLYEEAAWLYMQTGDNMLAIYASEKALRLAERLGEIRAASRAHGIFGRVFGRIGDTVKARENLERAVELARDSDSHETVLALTALGHHFESSDGDYASARDSYGEALDLAQLVGDVPAEIELHAAMAQLAIYAADWDEVIRCSDASARLAEREGLIGKLCLTYAVRGRLHWRTAHWDDSATSYRRAQELADQIGWSEVSFDALYGLSNTLRDQGDLDGADAALAQALEVCDRAGLIAQSIQANSARALVHRLAGRSEQASEAAGAAQELAARVPYPAGRAAAAEAGGIAGTLPQCASDLQDAREAWQALHRPLDAARCELLRGQRMLEQDPTEACASLNRAAAEYDRLGVAHLAGRARELAGTARPQRAGRRPPCERRRGAQAPGTSPGSRGPSGEPSRLCRAASGSTNGPFYLWCVCTSALNRRVRAKHARPVPMKVPIPIAFENSRSSARARCRSVIGPRLSADLPDARYSASNVGEPRPIGSSGRRFLNVVHARAGFADLALDHVGDRGLREHVLAASAASAKTPWESLPSGPSRISTISRTVTVEGSRAKR